MVDSNAQTPDNLIQKGKECIIDYQRDLNGIDFSESQLKEIWYIRNQIYDFICFENAAGKPSELEMLENSNIRDSKIGLAYVNALGNIWKYIELGGNSMLSLISSKTIRQSEDGCVQIRKGEIATALNVVDNVRQAFADFDQAKENIDILSFDVACRDSMSMCEKELEMVREGFEPLTEYVKEADAIIADAKKTNLAR